VIGGGFLEGGLAVRSDEEIEEVFCPGGIGGGFQGF
jgi:hypothetical protein